MELFLNLAWLIIAVASYILLVRNLVSRGTKPVRGPSRWQCVVALSFALAILFPVISLTDDLHEMQITVEEAVSSRIVLHWCGVNQSVTSIHALQQPSSFYIVSSSWTDVGRAAFGNTAIHRPALPSPGSSLTMSGRGPPALGLTQFS